LLLATESAAFAQTPILAMDQAEGFPGDVVTLRLVLTTGGVPVIAAESAFTYDTDQLTFVSASVTGSALTAGKMVDATVNGGVLEKLAVYDAGTNWSTPIADGDLPLMRFRIAPTATPGSLLTILTHDCSTTVAPATTRPATCGTGLVFVQVAGNSPVISLGNASGAAGTSVTLALGLATNGTLPIATETTIVYDASKLTYVSAVVGSAASAAGKSVDPSVAGGVLQKIAVYATGGSWDTPIGDGELALITFQIGAAVTPGSTLLVSIVGCKYTVAPAATTEVACGSNGSISVSGAATRTLTVQSSNPGSGVVITVSPTDENGLGNGTTPFTRIYDDGTQATLTAPASAGGNAFLKWQKDGVDQAGNPVVVAMGANHTLTAVYQPVAAAPVMSLGIGSGAAGTDVTLALGLATNGTLPIATEMAIAYDTTKLTYVSTAAGSAAIAAGKSVDPSVAGGVLQKIAVYATGGSWDTPIGDGELALITFQIGAGVTPGSTLPVSISGCKYTVASATTTEVACGSDGTIGVSGGTARTLTVQSSNPGSGVGITVSPADRDGLGNGTTPFTRSYDDGTQVTLTAPSHSGGNAFSKWQKDGVDQAGNSVMVAMGANHTLKAVYQAASVCPDADGDNYAVCSEGCSPAPGKQCGDCNDGNAAVHPNTTEVCNGIDDNCDTVTDNGGAALCDDGNVCTTDVCNGAAGCSHVNNNLSCNDGNTCTLNETCSGGNCSGGTARSCDDAHACTADVCDPVIGCMTSITNLDTGGFSADRVDGRDLVVLADAYNSCPNDERYDVAANLDRVQTLPGACIDGTDFHLFMTSFGRSCS